MIITNLVIQFESLSGFLSMMTTHLHYPLFYDFFKKKIAIETYLLVINICFFLYFLKMLF